MADNRPDQEEFEIEVVELQDDNGEKEEFAILQELEFEGKKFAISAPLAEVQALGPEDEADLTIEVFLVEDDNFTPLQDEELSNRLLAHLEAEAEKEVEEGK
jgi:hypothetical protein